MIHSMTGYAALSREIGQAALAVELKSVNSRFLDLQFRLPEELRPAEPALRELLAAGLSRGKLECRMAIQPATGAAPQLAINEALLAALARAERKILDALPEAQPLRVGDVLHWPGMLANEEADADTLRDAAVALVKTALAEFAATRAREGDKLKDMILERIERMQTRLALIQSHVPQAIAAYQERLAARLREALATSDEERIRHEIALFGVKIDIAEELNRLGAHLEEVRRVLAAGGAVGKRLDFLMQELNREANTLGSKSVSKELSDASLEFKLLIEQMREQIQNIE
ncbi:MAG: YicC family protein [Betaproteobacteria bacterium RBG_16_64_18]|nr:MAG: YicC family protein [Betaproteobacteria bacterium RBG_16_64_18]OGA39038.1 MAG: YicC family protein [Betaproteobacteria bacterium RIFCSPLOWO2_12_FULL_65_110]